MKIYQATAWRKHLVFGCTALVACLAASVLRSGEGRSADRPYGKFESREAEIADAVQKNGEIFVGWTKPDLALVFSGEMDGYLEPCGCAGLENQKGGLKRRHAFLKGLADEGWPLVMLDMGGMVRRAGPQAEMKYRFALKALVDLGYGAIGFGVRELQLSSDAVIYALANLDPDKNPMVSANVGLFSFDSNFSKKYKVIEAGGKRIGVTSVMGPQTESALKNSTDVTWIDPIDALKETTAALEKENCDLLVLMVHGTPDEARPLARKFPQFSYVAATGGAEEPPLKLEQIEGTKAQLVEAGHKGMYLMVVGLYDNAEQPVRVQRVPLDHRFEDSADMQQLLIDYQAELKATGFDGLGITGVKNPAAGFVGSAACADCHTEATEVFEGTPHAHATASIVELDPPRHFDPECLSCHVTGWQPQKYFPYESGYMSLESTPHLKENGCENCHGPGAAHVAAENGDVEADDAQLEKLRAALRLKIVENEGNKDGQVFDKGVVVKMCMECHDLDNSPDFDFQEYWPQVEHYGKD